MVRFDPEKDLNVDLTGKVILITGATSGIGFTTAQILVRKGAKVYLGARSEERARSAIKRIEDEGTSNSGKALYWPIDLADLRGVKKSAEEFIQKESKLDVLINNAAMCVIRHAQFDKANDSLSTTVPHNTDSYGVLDLMTVNYFAQVVLTETLLPLLKKTSEESDADVRIVNVGSDAYKSAPKSARFKSKEDFAVNTGSGFIGALKRCGRSKLASLLWTAELQRHLSAEKSNIIVICSHPGSVLTDNALSGTNMLPWPLSSLLRVLFRAFLVSPVVGSGNSLVCAVGPEIRFGPDAERYKGAYTVPIGKIATPTKAPANDEELAKELWDTTHALFKEWDL